MRRVPPSARRKSSSATPFRSMRCGGRASRKFIIGTRLWPPARILPSSRCSPRSASTSSSARGAWYSKSAGFIDTSSFPPYEGALAGLHHGRTEERDEQHRDDHGVELRDEERVAVVDEALAHADE